MMRIIYGELCNDLLPIMERRLVGKTLHLFDIVQMEANLKQASKSIKSVKAIGTYKALVTCYTKEETDIFLRNEGLLLREFFYELRM